MKLSEIVKYYNLLQSRELNPDYLTLIDAFRSTVLTVNQQSIQMDPVGQELAEDLAGIESAVEKFKHSLDQIKQNVTALINNLEPEMYRLSSERYSREVHWENCEFLQTRKLTLSNDSDELLRSRIRVHSDWRVPGMIIRPGYESFVEDMVPLDPLYLVDQNPELLEPATQGFTAEYQQRLRSYCVSDIDPEVKIFNELPQNQFGFVFAYNYFNFRPMEVIYRYIEEFYSLLRPGGTVIFTYNDCDVAHGVSLAEVFMSYTPGHKIRNQAEDVGFEIVRNQIGPYNISWFELRKPGTITSLRGGQTLAKIVQK